MILVVEPDATSLAHDPAWLCQLVSAGCNRSRVQPHVAAQNVEKALQRTFAHTSRPPSCTLSPCAKHVPQESVCDSNQPFAGTNIRNESPPVHAVMHQQKHYIGSIWQLSNTNRTKCANFRDTYLEDWLSWWCPRDSWLASQLPSESVVHPSCLRQHKYPTLFVR